MRELDKIKLKRLKEIKQDVGSRQKSFGSGKTHFGSDGSIRTKTDNPSQMCSLDKRGLDKGRRCLKGVINEEIDKRIEGIKSWIDAKDRTDDMIGTIYQDG